jgi:hypothetical protein
MQVLIEAWRGCHHLAMYVSQEVEGLQMAALQRQLAMLEQAAVQGQDMMRHLVTPSGDTGDPGGDSGAAGGGGGGEAAAEDLLLLVMEEEGGSDEEGDWEGPAAVTAQDRSQDVQAQVRDRLVLLPHGTSCIGCLLLNSSFYYFIVLKLKQPPCIGSRASCQSELV